MKRALTAALVLFVALAGAFAQEKGPVSVQYGAGIHYSEILLPTSGNEAVDMFAGLLNAITNFRGQAMVGAGLRVADLVVIGAEADAAAMSWSSTADDGYTTTTTSFFDLIGAATLRIDLGGNTGVTGLGGFVMSGVLGTGLSTSYSYMVGCRVSLGGLYGEYDRFFPLAAASAPYSRYGLGYVIGY